MLFAGISLWLWQIFHPGMLSQSGPDPSTSGADTVVQQQGVVDIALPVTINFDMWLTAAFCTIVLMTCCCCFVKIYRRFFGKLPCRKNREEESVPPEEEVDVEMNVLHGKALEKHDEDNESKKSSEPPIDMEDAMENLAESAEEIPRQSVRYVPGEPSVVYCNGVPFVIPPVPLITQGRRPIRI